MKTQNLLNVVESFRSLREGLDSVAIGYGELKDALVCAFFRRALGLKGHLLVFSAPGLAKTTLMKGASRLVANMNGGHVAYSRVQGRSDLTPEEFLSRRRTEYDEKDRLHFVSVLQNVKHFLVETVGAVPGFWFFDELDKTPGRAQFGLLQAMEEQQVTIEDETLDLCFTLFATANTKKYDPAAQPIPISVKDRFTAVVETGFLPLDDDIEVLKSFGMGQKQPLPPVKSLDPQDLIAVREVVAEHSLSGLLQIDEQIVRGCAMATKLTQTRLPRFTDFSTMLTPPAGPRSYIDFLQEAAAYSLIAGHDRVQPATCIKVGCRAYRGRVEATASVKMQAETADTVITKILHEVFAGVKMSGGGSGSRP
jgi:MoxR-like ATPase